MMWGPKTFGLWFPLGQKGAEGRFDGLWRVLPGHPLASVSWAPSGECFLGTLWRVFPGHPLASVSWAPYGGTRPQQTGVGGPGSSATGPSLPRLPLRRSTLAPGWTAAPGKLTAASGKQGWPKPRPWDPGLWEQKRCIESQKGAEGGSNSRLQGGQTRKGQNKPENATRGKKGKPAAAPMSGLWRKPEKTAPRDGRSLTAPLDGSSREPLEGPLRNGAETTAAL
ncbi:hypothetical protein M885DRAFT_520714 [Pelagophyceae sp. CCMP2097]|nr:hypothetical protein M885DRAFT_520714 [Pelagophyceae sp. CCMP2097]